MQSVEKPQYVCAIWDYEAIENNELTFKIGDYIEIVSTENEDWWEGILNGFQGFFPANRVKKVSQEENDIIYENMNFNANETNSSAIDANNNIDEGDNESISPLAPSYDNQYSPTTDPQYASTDDQDFNVSSLINTQLPENWVTEYDDNSGKYYYRNVQTNETSWEFPVYNYNIEEYEKDLPIGWKVSYASDGQIYYYNEYTNETSWDKPKQVDESEYKNSEPVEEYAELPYDNKLQINLPTNKIRKSSDLSVKYEYSHDKGHSDKGHWKSFVILCGSILLIYKKFVGPLSEQLPVKYVNIRNCQVDKSKKKKNVAVIVTSSEETVSLSCNNENDANAWIDEIKRYSVGDDDDDDSDIIEILDKAYAKAGEKNPYINGVKAESNHNNKSGKNSKNKYNIIKKVMKSQSNLVNDCLIFGGSLEEQVQKEGSNIPSIVIDCIREIEKRGIDTEGIYRLSGNTSVVNRLKEQYNKGETINFDDDEIDIPVLSSLLKSYFRELQDTLIPSSMYESFLEALRISNETERLQQFYELLHCLPQANFDVLSYLMRHLKEVSKKSEINKMAINNLAIVFGPTLIARTTDKEALAATIIADTPYQNNLINIIIKNEKYFFRTPPLEES